jgi:hypothetical protein
VPTIRPLRSDSPQLQICRDQNRPLRIGANCTKSLHHGRRAGRLRGFNDGIERWSKPWAIAKVGTTGEKPNSRHPRCSDGGPRHKWLAISFLEHGGLVDGRHDTTRPLSGHSRDRQEAQFATALSAEARAELLLMLLIFLTAAAVAICRRGAATG